MDLNQSPSSEPSCDPGLHLQFQISLLRLMEQKSMEQKTTDQTRMGQKTMGQKTLNQQAGSKEGTSAQVAELEGFQRRRQVPVGLNTPS
jgi:hypothetical protein